MLPVDSISFKLTVESRRKLDFFYRSFCEGKNGRRYGISHIVYACHASFPLLLSPELANLIWLNFSTYVQNGSLKKTDRIVVSDLLLSTLVRPVANRQFEIIPEIRNYLLHLLKDSQWFNFLGIESFGDKRLESLAQFLRQYLAHKKSNAENIASGFKEINEWTALAYLEPNVLAFNIFEAYKKTFDTSNDKKIDEYGQLRLNLLMDKFRQQIDLDLHQTSDEKPAAFINLHKYSKANKDSLFGVDNSNISDQLFGLDPNFITEKNTSDADIYLPVKKENSERLSRKSKGITRLFVLIIAIDDYSADNNDTSGCALGAEYLAQSIQTYSGKTNLQLNDISILVDNETTLREGIKALDDIAGKTLPEDSVLIYLSGEFSSLDGNEYFVFKKPAKEKEAVNIISSQDLKQNLSQIRSVNKTLILEGNTDRRKWEDVADILITATMDDTEHSSAANFPEGFMRLLPYYLGNFLLHTETAISNIDLQTFLRHKFNSINTKREIIQTPCIGAKNELLLQNYFLDNKSNSNSNGHLITYNVAERSWEVLEEAFKLVDLNKTTRAYNYETGNEVANVIGELFIRYNTVSFGGQSDDLNPNKLYKIIPEKSKLFFKFSSSVAEADSIESKIFSELANKKVFEFSIWSSINKIDTDGLSEYPLLEINKYESDNHRYNISFLQSGASIQQSNQSPIQSSIFKWQVAGIETLGASIKHFIRYHYVSSLHLYPNNPFRYSNFEVEINCRWDNEELYKDRLLTVDENSFIIKDGQILFKPFSIEINSHEEFPIFYDIYLISSDFSIEKVEKSKNDIIELRKEVSIRIDKNELFHRVLEKELTFTIKVLLSKNPITIDFSQKAGF